MNRRHQDTIRHRGIVDSIEGRKCVVRILQSSACQGCTARQLCSSSESKEKLVEVHVQEAGLEVGQHVMLEGSVRQGLRAVYICYLIPLAMMVGVLAYFTLRFSEEIGALSALASLSLYYLGLYLLRDRVGRNFVFRIVSEETASS